MDRAGSDPAEATRDAGAVGRPAASGAKRLRVACLVLGLLMPLVGASLVLVNSLLAEYRSKRVVAQQCEQLRRIGIGLLIYASEFDGALPPTLALLAERGDVDAADLRVPDVHKRNRVNEVGYIPGLTTADAGDLMIAYADNSFYNGGKVPVLQLDGTVRFVDAESFGRAMGRSFAAPWQRAGRAASLPTRR